jgi:hypothetical protein
MEKWRDPIALFTKTKLLSYISNLSESEKSILDPNPAPPDRGPGEIDLSRLRCRHSRPPLSPPSPPSLSPSGGRKQGRRRPRAARPWPGRDPLAAAERAAEWRTWAHSLLTANAWERDDAFVHRRALERQNGCCVWVLCWRPFFICKNTVLTYFWVWVLLIESV